MTLVLGALVAFASNSLLTRLALGAHQIDAATFTTIRLMSGAVVLSAAVRIRQGTWSSLRSGDIAGPLSLNVYALPFSFAYLRIGAAVGALVMFAVVQLTMVGYAIARGEHPRPLAWLGLVLATSGLVLLTLRSTARPDPVGILLMVMAGVGWGAYSIAGRGNSDPLATNARSFLWSAPLSLLVNLATHGSLMATGRGVALALASGALASGVGYAIWYRALPRISVTQAAVAQLFVPVLAAVGAVGLLGEPLTSRLVLSGAAVLGGIALVLVSRLSSTNQR